MITFILWNLAIGLALAFVVLYVLTEIFNFTVGLLERVRGRIRM